MAETTPKSKELSPETQGIVNNLIREGERVRNDGKELIKATTINLDKFADAFTAIQIGTEQTTKALTDSWKGNEALLKNIDESLDAQFDEWQDVEKARSDQAKRDSIEDKENKSESGILAQSLKQLFRWDLKV